MANYFEYSQLYQQDPHEIGLGFGDDAEGQPVICIAGLAPKDERGLDWTALTPECARKLYKLLSECRSVVEVSEPVAAVPANEG